MIRFEGINIVFNKQQIFKAFSLRIEKGEKVLLSAPSGSGKSTLLKSLLGFQQLDGGTIYVKGKTLSKHTLQQVRTSISYVSQDVELGNRTAKDLIAEIFAFKLNKHIAMDFDKIEAQGMQYGLPAGFLDKNINQLSGGERQRLGFIICILLDREIWILDEVTSGLDSELKKLIVERVMATDKTVIISSHDAVWKAYDVRVVTW